MFTRRTFSCLLAAGFALAVLSPLSVPLAAQDAQRTGDADGLTGNHLHEDLRVVRKRDTSFHSFGNNGQRERHAAREAKHIS